MDGWISIEAWHCMGWDVVSRYIFGWILLDLMVIAGSITDLTV